VVVGVIEHWRNWRYVAGCVRAVATMDGSFQCHGADERHIELHYGMIGIYKNENH
jgi:hypothetical protein